MHKTGLTTRYDSKTLRAMAKAARHRHITKGEFVRQVVKRALPDAAPFYQAELAQSLHEDLATVESMRELRKMFGELSGDRLEKRIEAAVAKAISSLNTSATYRGSAIDGYTMDSGGSELEAGGYPGGGEHTASEDTADAVEGSESESSGWQSDRNQNYGADASDLEAAPVFTKAQRKKLLRSLGIKLRKKLKKSASVADVNPTQAFTLAKNDDFVPEKSAGYRTGEDNGSGTLPAFLSTVRALAENDTIAKRADVTQARTPKDVNRLGKVIAAGCDGDPTDYADAVNALFGTLKKA